MSTPSTPNITALSTPNMGPASFPARRGGSVSGGAWQLIEVNSKEDKEKVRKSVSNHGTPLIGAQRSPPTQPGGAPVEVEELNIGEPAMPTEAPEELKGNTGKGGKGGYNHDGKGGYNHDRWAAEDEEEEEDPDGFNSQYFIGDWTDNLGHRILVSPSENGGRQRDRRRRNKGGGKGRGKVFLAVMYKFGMPDKRFNVNKDRAKSEWTCGTGVLNREESTSETIKWKAPDGRLSTWTRSPPEGPVFFDAPAAQQMQEEDQSWWNQNPGVQMHPDGPVYFMHDYHASSQGEWKGLNLPPDAAGNHGESAGEQGVKEGSSSQWNLTAAEFVPGGAPAAAVSATPPLKPGTAPSTPLMNLQVPSGPAGAQALACLLKLSEESPDVTVAGNRLEWVLPDLWGKLKRFPKDFCLTSPMFGVRQATNMQLVFYPNGSRTAEAGRCTVALTRGPDSAGIKFEFSVNGRSSGPKVCLGRRYLGDYPQPFEKETEDNNERQVTVCMQVLEVLGI